MLCRRQFGWGNPAAQKTGHDALLHARLLCVLRGENRLFTNASDNGDQCNKNKYTDKENTNLHRNSAVFSVMMRMPTHDLSSMSVF